MRRSEIRLLFGFPFVLLTASFVIVCVRFSTLWPWPLVVHEDGERTLSGTIFYFEHALGELPLELILAAAAAGAALLFFRAHGSPLLRVLAGIAALSADLIIFAGAWASVGFSSALTWLLQYHTRKDAPLVFGSHWRYHLLSQAALLLWAALLLRMLVMWRFALAPRGSRKLWISSWAAFAAGCLVFGVTAETFRDPLHLGHQARETFTHALVTVPLAAGLLLLFEDGPQVERAPRRSLLPGTLWIASMCAVLVAYQAWGAAATGASGHAQTRDLTSVVCVHFFEHTLSYLVVPLHALWFFLLGGREVDC